MNKIYTSSLFYSTVLHLLPPFVWVLPSMTPTTVVGDTVADVIEVPLAFPWHSNSTYPTWWQRKDDPNNASGSASGYRANAHTHMHTRAHTICVLPSWEEQRSRHMCLPELLLRKSSGSDSVLAGENKVNSDFIRQLSYSPCISNSLWFTMFHLSPHSDFPSCFRPGGGSSGRGGFSGTPFQANHLPQVLWAWRVSNGTGAWCQRKPHCMEGRGSALW